MSPEPPELLPPGGWCLLVVRALVEDGTLSPERCREALRPLEKRIAFGLGDEAAASDARRMVAALVEALFDEELRGRFLRSALLREGAASAALVVLEGLLSKGALSDATVAEGLAAAVRDGATSPTDGRAFWNMVGRPDLGDHLFQLVSDGEGEVS